MPAWLAGWGAKLAVAGAFVGLVLMGVLRLIGIGRDQERYKASTKALQRTQDANQARAQASLPISTEDEARDPFNRDSR